MAHDSAAGYDPAFFHKLDRIEDRHFWFRARKRAVAAAVFSLTTDLSDGYHVLELGCGNGGMLKLLQQSCPRGRVFGMDLFAEGLANARQRSSAPLVRGDVHHPPFAQSLDVVCMFDVLEHLPDDVGVLSDVCTMLAPGGRLLLTVPAHMQLWSYFDEAACHQRRYTVDTLAASIAAAGLTLEYATDFMSTIYPLVWAGRRLNGALQRFRRRRRADAAAFELTTADFRIIPGLNAALACSLSWEPSQIRRRRRLPRGTSVLAIARR